MARIIVSAGHTNDQPGTISDGIREVDLTRKVASEVVKELRKADIVTLSVPPNLDLARRIAWINQTGYTEEDGDLAIEIHINEGGKSGIEGWHQADKSNSIDLTKSVTDQVKQALDWEIQGIKSEYEHELGSLAFLHNTNPIASLLECGYMDNPDDLKILKSDDGVTKLAIAIAKGVLNHLKKQSREEDQKDGDKDEHSDAKDAEDPDEKANHGNVSSTSDEETKKKDDTGQQAQSTPKTQKQSQANNQSDSKSQAKSQSPVSNLAGSGQSQQYNKPTNQYTPQQVRPAGPTAGTMGGL
ncbi:hypothetical protein GF389_04035, partial [Candidatus Dojkabacteria bacterium]|nr:hypothetical protein [Candidatus Dojkabacteria bacterium]